MVRFVTLRMIRKQVAKLTYEHTHCATLDTCAHTHTHSTHSTHSHTWQHKYKTSRFHGKSMRGVREQNFTQILRAKCKTRWRLKGFHIDAEREIERWRESERESSCIDCMGKPLSIDETLDCWSIKMEQEES